MVQQIVELARDREQLLSILETAPDPVIVIDEDGTIRSFNAAAVKTFGYMPEEVLGHNVKMLMPPPDRDLHDFYLERYAKTGEAHIIGIGREVVALRKDGTTFPARLAISETKIGEHRLFTGFLQNLSAQKSAEAGLAREKEQMQSILETAPDPIVVIDERGIVQSFNNAAVKTFGYEPEEVVGRNVSMLMPSPDRERHDSYIERYLATNEAHIIGIGREVMAQKKDGTTFPARLAISETRIGEHRLFTGFLQNLSGRKAAESELQDQQNRMREIQAQLYVASRHGDLGEMASSIAHELNQPLTAILNYVQTCRDLLKRADEGVATKVEDYLNRAAIQADRAGLIIRRLRQLYERGDADAVPDDLNEAVQEALDLALIGTKENGIEVRLELDLGVAEVSMDRQQIQQVVINLVRNAVEAMAAVERREIVVRTRPTEDHMAEFMVRDTGPGLAPEIAANLFEPFHTTKPTGMGLGLSICRSIIEAHGGKIWVTPTPGGGTTFHFTLNTVGSLQ